MTILITSIFIIRLYITAPISLRLFIIIITISLSLFISITWFSWFGIILFLIYVGGIIVIFVYFASLTPNQAFSSWKSLCTFIFTFLISYYINLENKLFITVINKNAELIHLFTSIYTPLTILLIIFLFFILVIAVKISFNQKIPIRLLK